MPLYPDYWWQDSIPRIDDTVLEEQPLRGHWMTQNTYRFTHPVSGRHQDMVFPGADRLDQDVLDRLIHDQERRAMHELASPVKDGKVTKERISRRMTLIKGRETAVKERWY